MGVEFTEVVLSIGTTGIIVFAIEKYGRRRNTKEDNPMLDGKI